MGCCFPKSKTKADTASDTESGTANQSQPLIENGAQSPSSPNATRKKKRGNKQPVEINPFNKPRKFAFLDRFSICCVCTRVRMVI